MTVSPSLPLSPSPQEMVESFCRRLLDKGRKMRTVRTYKTMLNICMEHLGWPDPSEITEDDIIELRQTIPIKEASLKAYLYIFGVFLENSTGTNTVKKADILWNRTEARRKFITVEEFRRLQFNADARDKLVLALGGMMGLRRMEIAGIRLSDIDGRVLTVRGKGHGVEGKVAYVTMPQPVLDAIAEWMPIRQRILDDTGHRAGDALIVTYAGLACKPTSISYMMNSLADRSGVDFTPHCLRRLYATTLYRNGTDLDTLRRMMRHSHVQTTVDCYIAADPDKINQAVDTITAVLG